MKRLLRDLVEELKTRNAALTKIWKPYKRVIWAASIPTAVYEFIINTGGFIAIVVGFIALVCFLVFGPPFAGSYLLGLRVLALLADLLLVSFVSFIVWTTRSDFLMEHQGQVLMVTLWVTCSTLRQKKIFFFVGCVQETTRSIFQSKYAPRLHILFRSSALRTKFAFSCWDMLISS
jgi:hypothetical protein